jgi:DNA polymerase-1
MVGYHVNPNSPDEVSELLYERYGLKIKGKTPQDTRKETFDKLPPHPAVQLIRKYRSTTKMLSTYIAGIEKRARGDRIHTTFKLHATTTGRLSSSEPNIQNIPREARYRRMYRARPGFVLLEADYNMAELRMLAALSGDRFLTGVFLDDKRNLHDEVSVAMYGADYTGDQRIRAKAINFGIPYGRKAFSVAEEHDMSVSEAQRLIDAWFARAPEAAQFLKRQRAAPSEGRTLVTVFGRKRRPGIVSAERIEGLQNEFANFHMQSPVSDFTLHAGMEFLPLVKQYDAHIVNLVHDSTVTEVPDDPVIIAKVARIIKEAQEGVPTKWIKTPIRFKVDMKKGTHWGLSEKYELPERSVIAMAA